MSVLRRSKSVVVLPGGTVELRELDLRPLRSDEVLVRVQATPIHPADLNAIEGKYPGGPTPPYVGGREGSGVVEEIGAQVATLNPGDLVMLPSDGGTWRDYAICLAADLVPVPSSVGPTQAALLRVNPASALRMLRDYVPLLPGEWIAQNGGNSAVGRAVTQLARHFGWHTVSLVRDPEVLDEDLLKTGDIFLADDPDADLLAASRHPIRLGLNAVGGESALRIANCLSDGGTLVTYGAMARQPLRIPNGLLIFRDLHVRGFWVSRWSGHATAAGVQGMMTELIGLAVAGVLRSQIATIYPFEACADAIAHAGRRHRPGKILFGSEEVLGRNS